MWVAMVAPRILSTVGCNGLVSRVAVSRYRGATARHVACLSSLSDPSEVLSPTKISLDESLGVLESTLTFIRLGLPGRKLDELHTDPRATVQEKWEGMMQIRVQTELHVIAAFGYEANQMGMLAYRQTMAQLLEATIPTGREAIQALDKQIWAEIIHRTFAITAESMELQKARQVTLTVTSALQQESFLSQLDESMKDLGGEASDSDKNKALQQHLLAIWTEVLPNFGFKGDDGYVRFQAALVEHSSDAEIATMIQSALVVVTRRIGLNK